MSVTCMKNKHIFFTIGAVLFFVYAFVGCKQSYSPALADKVDFNYDIRPILVQKCYLCHGPDASSRKGNLRLDTYEGATALTKNGEKAIDPIHSEKSLLLYRINHKDPEILMPTPESKLKLTEREIALLKKWIEQGAEWKPYWAFIAPHETEEVKKYSGNPIDYFIEKKLKENDIDPQEQADKNALIRRVSYLLTGLPPTPEAIQKYIADDSKEGYTKIVDHYLQSPQYGERWATKTVEFSLPRNSNRRGSTDSILGASMSISSVMPVSSVINGGSCVPGFTKVLNVPNTSPPQTLTAPISVIALPVFGDAPDVSKSRTTKVV